MQFHKVEAIFPLENFVKKDVFSAIKQKIFGLEVNFFDGLIFQYHTERAEQLHRCLFLNSNQYKEIFKPFEGCQSA